MKDFPIAGAEVKIQVEVRYHELEKFINATYPKILYGGYCFQADEEMGNNSEKSYDVSSIEPLLSFEQEQFDEHTQGIEHHSYMTRTLLQGMVNLGLLPPCNLLVRMSY